MTTNSEDDSDDDDDKSDISDRRSSRSRKFRSERASDEMLPPPGSRSGGIPDNLGEFSLL